jgi:hypothetical protein
MEQILALVQVIIEKGPVYIASIVAVLSALIALFLLIPGEQPEKALQAIVDFLAKFSAKKKE